MSGWKFRKPRTAFNPPELLERLKDRVRRDLEAAGQGDAYWWTLDDIDQDILLCKLAEDLLKENGIDVAHSKPDITGMAPALVFLVKLQEVLQKAWDNLELGGPEFYRDTVNSGWGSIERFFAGWAEHEAELQRRAAVSAGGARARGERKSDWKAEAIKLFDPGPEAGNKSHRARIIRQKAIKNGFRDAEKLPKRLDKYLS